MAEDASEAAAAAGRPHCKKTKRRVSQLVESVLPQQKTREDLLTKCDNDARIDRYVRKKGK